MAQLMPLPLTVSCFSKIQIGFTFLVPAHPGSLGKRAVKRLCSVCWSVLQRYVEHMILGYMRLHRWNSSRVNIRVSRLHSSTSAVLMATGLVNGRWQFSTPTESTPFNWLPKNLLQLITLATATVVPNLVQIRPWGIGGFWANGWNITKFLKIYLFIPFTTRRCASAVYAVFVCLPVHPSVGVCLSIHLS